MDKLYEILIRFHPDGKIGAAAYFYEADGVTPNPVPLSLHSDDFPALSKKTLADVLGEHADTLKAAAAVTETVILAQQEREELQEFRQTQRLATLGAPVGIVIEPDDTPEIIAAKVEAAQKILTRRTADLIANARVIPEAPGDRL